MSSAVIRLVVNLTRHAVNIIRYVINPTGYAGHLPRYVVHPYGYDIKSNPVSGRKKAVYGQRDPSGRSPVSDSI
ncbi:hypothetical protein LS482_08620 [Sinomicrobium kalidii]|uniref:hypothetical protein n=1 Tax=Sinomicrobium kalidii TaxID=2900738 RepID=UPI001E45F7AD|nr:hypothetical protein [Sinomicrobium kalidii]UGU17930.1 hypothetical protein LS482_08620 [Sinomicrobium kalidii]